MHLVDRLAVWSSLWQFAAYASSKEVLNSKTTDRGVVDSVNLHAHEGHAHSFSHAHGQVVDV